MLFTTFAVAAMAPLLASASVLHRIPHMIRDAPYQNQTRAMALKVVGEDLCVGATMTDFKLGGILNIYNCRQPPCSGPECAPNNFQNRTIVFEPFPTGRTALHVDDALQHELCVEAISVGDGSALKLGTCNIKEPKQDWTLNQDGHLQLTGTNQCVDIKDGTKQDNGALQTWTCATGNDNQIFESTGFPKLPMTFEGHY